MGFPDGTSDKEPTCQCKRDVGSIPGLRRSLGMGDSNPLQYLAWRIPMDRGAWKTTVRRVAESGTTEAT